MHPTQAPFIFVIDTEDYAGNFERELCAYITGNVGECNVGSEMAECFTEETGLTPFDNLAFTADEDDHGCLRPAKIYPTLGWFNNGSGGNFRDGQDADALKAFIRAVEEYNQGHIKLLNDKLHTYKSGTELEKENLNKSGWSLEACQRELSRHQKLISDAHALKVPSKYPSYLSVAIYFQTKPTAKQIALMKERSFKFAQLPHKWNKGKPTISKITGFQLIRQTQTITKENILD